MSTAERSPAKRRKFSLNFFKDTVKVIIGSGETKVEIDIPRHRLCEVSEFFAAGCSSRWASGREGVISLEDESPKVFSLFLAWAFDGDLRKSEDYITGDRTDPVKLQRSALDRHRQLIDCFLLGQKLLAHDFKNAAMDLIIESYEIFTEDTGVIPTSSSIIDKIYGESTPDSPLRRSLVDTVLKKSSPDFFALDFSRSGSSKYYKEYLIELLSAAHPFFSSRKSVSTSKTCYEKDPCEYHEHPGRPATYRCMYSGLGS